MIKHDDKRPQLTFRPEEPAAVDALAEEAKKERRSVNQMLSILLEEALAARGAWPRQQPSEPAQHH